MNSELAIFDKSFDRMMPFEISVDDFMLSSRTKADVYRFLAGLESIKRKAVRGGWKVVDFVDQKTMRRVVRFKPNG